MAKLPSSPSPDALRDLLPFQEGELVVVRAGALLWRIYSAGGPFPTRWNAFRRHGPVVTSRFDHHLPPPRVQERGISYSTDQIDTCVAEYFQDTRTIERHRRAPALVGFELAQDLELLNLRGRWPTRAGGSMKINSGPRSTARAWSQSIFSAYPTVKGLLYASSMHANAPAYALYERAQGAMPVRPVFHRPLSDPALLGPLATASRKLGYRLFP